MSNRPWGLACRDRLIMEPGAKEGAVPASVGLLLRHLDIGLEDGPERLAASLSPPKVAET